MAEINRIAEATGFRRAGVTDWEDLEYAAGLKRGALSGARAGSQPRPDTLVALARYARESPWHLLKPACGTTHVDALQYLREWAERQHVTPEMVAEVNRWTLLEEEDQHRLATGLRVLLEVVRPPAPSVEPEPSAPPSEPGQNGEPGASNKPESPGP